MIMRRVDNIEVEFDSLVVKQKDVYVYRDLKLLPTIPSVFHPHFLFWLPLSGCDGEAPKD